MGDKRRNSSLFPISWESGNRVLWDGVREIGVQWAGRCDCDRYYSYLHPLDFDSIFFFCCETRAPDPIWDRVFGSAPQGRDG